MFYDLKMHYLISVKILAGSTFTAAFYTVQTPSNYPELFQKWTNRVSIASATSEVFDLSFRPQKDRYLYVSPGVQTKSSQRIFEGRTSNDHKDDLL